MSGEAEFKFEKMMASRQAVGLLNGQKDFWKVFSLGKFVDGVFRKFNFLEGEKVLEAV